MPLTRTGATSRGVMPVLKCIAILVVVAALLFIGETMLEPAGAGARSIGSTMSDTARAPGPAPALPQIGLMTDPADSTDTRIARDLARLVAPDAGIDLVAPVDAASAVAPLLAIIRHDALEAARTGEVSARKAISGLRLVTPLYTEEIYFIVRRDSPLVYIHDIREARINLGPTQSSRGLTVARLYEQMFGTAIPTANANFLSDEDALARLVTDQTLDVMAVIAAQPVEWLARLKPQLAQSIKLLEFNREHPWSRRASEAYLPATIRATNYGAWLRRDTPTLAVMSFLVTSDYTDQASTERIGAFAQSLCRNLSVLRRDGHPKWREVRPGPQVDAALPYSVPAEAAFHSCRS